MSISTASAQAPDPQAVFHRLERFYSQVSAGDLDAAMTLYAADARIILSGQEPVQGLADIRHWWQATLKDYEFLVTPRLVEATALGDTVVLQGEALGRLLAKSGGAASEVDIWFMQIYRRQPGGEYLFWRGSSGPNPRRQAAGSATPPAGAIAERR